jgi:hypothetical protein
MTGTPLAIPILPQVQTVLDAIPQSELLTLMTTRYGKPYTPRGLTMAFAEWREQAVLPKGLVPHGLRKSACRRLAEHGCSTKEIAAISGHLSPAGGGEIYDGGRSGTIGEGGNGEARQKPTVNKDLQTLASGLWNRAKSPEFSISRIQPNSAS